MHNMATRHVSRDQTLDYLFQVPGDEQFESLRMIQVRSKQQESFLRRIKGWFCKNIPEKASFSEYLEQN